jgi:hypothetical protein
MGRALERNLVGIQNNNEELNRGNPFSPHI